MLAAQPGALRLDETRPIEQSVTGSESAANTENMALLELAQDYILTHDLRDTTGTIYLASTRALLRHFGTEISAEEIDHRGVLGCRKALLENGLSKRSWNTYSNHLRTIWGYALDHGTLTIRRSTRSRKLPSFRQSARARQLCAMR